jgi:hypothetical protein
MQNFWQQTPPGAHAFASLPLAIYDLPFAPKKA